MDDYESLTIEVTGIHINTSRDTLDNYFSSSRRGGNITNIEYTKGSGNASITFANAEGAKKALATGPHSVEDYTLTIRRKKAGISESDKVFVAGNYAKTSKDCRHQFENRTEGTRDSDMKYFKYGKRSETMNALVTFHSPIDFDKLQEGFRKKPTLEEKHISIKTVPVCKTILVKNLPPKASNDSVRYRFENERHGGGDVEEVRLDQKKRIALVEFKDPNVIDKVLSVKQTLEGKVLSVERFYPIIGSVDLQLKERNTSDQSRREVVKSRLSLPDLNPSRRERPVPKPRNSLSESHVTERKTSDPTHREITIGKPRDSLPESHVTERKTSDPTHRELPRPKPRNSLSESHLTERETSDPTHRELPIGKPRHSLPESLLRERETSDPTHREPPIRKPIPKPRPKKPTVDVDLDLYLYLKDNYPAQMSLALKDPQPNIEKRDESVHFTFSTQDARDHFLNYLKDYKCEIVPVNPVLLNHGLREDIKEATSAGLVSVKERTNEGFIKLVGRAMAFDRVVDKVKKCIANVEERNSRLEDVIEILPVHLKLLLRSTRFQRQGI